MSSPASSSARQSANSVALRRRPWLTSSICVLDRLGCIGARLRSRPARRRRRSRSSDPRRSCRRPVRTRRTADGTGASPPAGAADGAVPLMPCDDGRVGRRRPSRRSCCSACRRRCTTATASGPTPAAIAACITWPPSSLNPITTTASGAGVGELLRFGLVVPGVGVVQDRVVGDVAPPSSSSSLQRVGEAGAVLVVPGDDRDLRLAVAR